LRHGVHHHVACWIRPRLQVTFFALLEDCYPGRLAVKDRDKTPRITGVILVMWYQSQVDHREYILLIDLRIVFSEQFSDRF
jgi:hypothetical protein